jgi:C1A family cysteine protease
VHISQQSDDREIMCWKYIKISDPLVRHMNNLIPLDSFLEKTKSRKRSLDHHTVARNRDLLPESESVSLQRYVKNVYIQGNLGSCNANAICSLIKITAPDSDPFEPSRLWIYTMEQILGHPGEQIIDRGADPMDGCMIINQLGVCAESEFPYLMDKDQNVINFGEKPSDSMINSALSHRYPGFKDVTDTNNGSLLETIQICLSGGYPVLMAFIMFSSFMDQSVRKTGIVLVPMADPLDQPIGGHEVLIVGYEPGYLLVLNSWGPEWGLGGFFKMPVEYLTARWQGIDLVNQILILRPVPTLNEKTLE